jgi:hypothetical protein
MDPEAAAALLASITELVTGLRADVEKHTETMSAKYADAMKKIDEAGVRRKKSDEDDDEDGRNEKGMAQQTAADSVDPAAFASLARTVHDMRQQQVRPYGDMNAFADVQAKADTVMRALGSSAEPPMRGEDLVAYKIRTHRAMQPHSAKWKGVELKIIAADHVALDNVLAEIRTDATQAGLNPVGLPEFQHRMITETLPGGHTSRRFVGNGTIFKQMTRPTRQVSYIGVRTGTGG